MARYVPSLLGLATLLLANPAAGDPPISIYCGRYNCAATPQGVLQDVIRWENQGNGTWHLVGTGITISYRWSFGDYEIKHGSDGSRNAANRAQAMEDAVAWARELKANGIDP